ncbi:MAG: hypothetical protein WC508_02625 [Patescibacteria group bacterium]
MKKKQKHKIAALRNHYSLAKTELDKKAIIEKALRINPFLSKESFLAAIKDTVAKIVKKKPLGQV